MSKKVVKIIGAVMAVVLAICLCAVAFIYLRYPLKYGDEIAKAAQESSLDKNLLRAVIWTESKFKPRAVSKSGAKGLMQLMDSTLQWGRDTLNIENVDVFDAQINIRIGAAYLQYLIQKFESVKLALYAYNAGEGRVSQWLEEGTGIAFEETREYAKRVFSAQKMYEFISR